MGPSHLAVIALILVLAAGLVLVARRMRMADAVLRPALALVLAVGWAGWWWTTKSQGLLTLENGLPLNLCDWAEIVLIVALLTRHQFAYELGYFWGLGGTLQGVLTPPLYYDWPHPQFIFFFLQHGGVIVALLYLTLGTGLRPFWGSLPRVAVASLFYLACAGLADWLLGLNYGFLRAKPAGENLLTLMAPWPWYIPELVAAGLVFLLVYYAPFALADWHKARRNTPKST